MKKHSCEDCGEPAQLRSWSFVHTEKFAIGKGKKVYRWLCNDHFLIHHFNLWPFCCTTKCRKSHGQKIGVPVSHRDYIWFNLVTVLVPAAKEVPGQSVPLKLISPKCPWCGKGMRRVNRRK